MAKFLEAGVLGEKHTILQAIAVLLLDRTKNEEIIFRYFSSLEMRLLRENETVKTDDKSDYSLLTIGRHLNNK